MNWNLASLVLSVAGACLGMCGTLIMAHAYHANGIAGFLMTVLMLPRIFAQGGLSAVRDFWHEQASRGNPSEEDRSYSIAGLTLIFLGFLLQVFGSVCSYIGALPGGAPSALPG